MKYNVMFKGEIAKEISFEVVKKNIAKVFKIEPKRVDKFFIGKPVILKKNLDYEAAMNVRRIFEKTGAKCNVIPINNEGNVLLKQKDEKKVEIPNKAIPLEGPLVVCIKCGYEQPFANECSKCGIIFDKFQGKQELEKFKETVNEEAAKSDEFIDYVAGTNLASDIFPVKLALLIVGIVLCYFGYSDYQIKTTLSGGPIPISIEDIDEGRLIANSYITISEHVRLYPASVYSYDKDILSFSNDHVPNTKINYNVYPIVADYHPLIPDVRLFKERAETVGISATEAVSNSKTFKILVKSNSMKTADEVPFVIERSDLIVGLVKDKFSSLDKKVKNLVKVSFPLLDTEKLIVLEKDKKPLSKTTSLGIISCGVILILGASILLFKGSF